MLNDHKRFAATSAIANHDDEPGHTGDDSYAERLADNVLQRATGVFDAITITMPVPVVAVTLPPQVAIPRRLTIDAGALWRWLVSHWELVVIASVLLTVGLAHGINMFHYPYFEDDEGIYVSQAWAVGHIAKLAPYTYWYDHAPAGWLLMAGWSLVTGGATLFGDAMNAGRVFMLVLQLGSTWMVYQIARKTTSHPAIAVMVALLFSLSPYGIYYQRRILLDNIATFWMLMSILALVYTPRLKLRQVWLSALVFSLSVLSKEITLILLPVLCYLVYYRAEPFQRVFACIGWLSGVIAAMSVYVLMAQLNGELFPSGTPLGGTNPHVSLIGTILWQSQRGKDGGLSDWHSAFWTMARQWAFGGPVPGDLLLVVGGTLCAIALLCAMRAHRVAGVLGVATLALWLFLARGGMIMSFYLVPVLPLLALNIGHALEIGMQTAQRLYEQRSALLRRLGQQYTWLHALISHAVKWGVPSVAVGMSFMAILLLVPAQGKAAAQVTALFTSHQADAQTSAIVWARANLPAGSSIVIDDSMYTDLIEANKDFQLYWYWKVDSDPAVRDGELHDDWNNVDYVITSPQMLYDSKTAPLPLVGASITHSISVISFDTGSWKMDIRKIVHRPPGLTAPPTASTALTLTPSQPVALMASLPPTLPDYIRLTELV